MADVAATIWAAPVLSRDFAQSPGQAAALIGGVLIIAGVVGSIMGGVVADWGHKRNMRGGVLIGAVVAAAIGVPAGLFPVMTDTTMFGVVLLILMISGTVCGLVTATAIAVLVPNEERGTCLGAFMILGTLIGMGVNCLQGYLLGPPSRQTDSYFEQERSDWIAGDFGRRSGRSVHHLHESTEGSELRAGGQPLSRR